jgi:hypothetical protein
MNKEFGNKFYSYLMDYQCDDFKLLHIPITETKQNIINTSMPSPLKFFHYLKEQLSLKIDDREHYIKCKSNKNYIKEIEEGENKIDIEIKASDLYNMYKDYCNDKKEYLLNNSKFGESIKTLCGGRRTASGYCYLFSIDKIIYHDQ